MHVHACSITINSYGDYVHAYSITIATVTMHACSITIATVTMHACSITIATVTKKVHASPAPICFLN